MKPKRIILLRHSQSEGNVSKSIYKEKPDYALNITTEGKLQALKAGEELNDIIGDESVACYISPYYRTRQTFEIIKTQLKEKIKFEREDPRLREAEWRIASKFDNSEDERSERDRLGKFYYRFARGEAVADVYSRLSTFLDTLFRDFEKPEFPDNALIVGHGMTNRVLIMRWFHLKVEEFELLRNPKNCEYYILQKNDKNKYDLITPIKKHEKLQRIY